MAYLSGQVGPDGAMSVPCPARVLESVLTERLLARHGGHDPALERVRAYLAHARDHGDLSALDRALLGLPLGEDLLEGLDHYTAARKRVLVNTVLYLAGVHPGLQVEVGEIGMPVGTLQTWKRTEWLACRVIHAHAHGRTVDNVDLKHLAEAVQGPVIYEHLHLAHLICLHALSPHPAHAEAVRHGLALMADTQLPDGGFTVAVDFDLWVPSIAACALAENAADPALLNRIATWMAPHQAGNGGWPYRPQVEQTDVDTTYTVLAFLQRHDSAAYSRQIDAGHAYLYEVQNEDGGWSTYPAGSSEPAMTGGALAVLAVRQDLGAQRLQALRRAVHWLARAQRGDGAFERGWSLAENNAVFRAVHGLVAARDLALLPAEDQHLIDRALTAATRYLTDTQNSDGGWGHRQGSPSDATSTGCALAALGRLKQTGAVRAALHYLAGQQQPDGSFHAVPDTTAPRGLPIDVPYMPTAYVLRGLADAQ
ncbi:prenyltransferase/squalene oxidase repeat-containing protein [Kitasatospora purpeofusca]|uniref:prenyltransferase/squalene oxidase repeat-containing protein n=1 Tax=Kitasatospora purpeofusca TaxID=67352 RepID=UPI002A5A26E5|nr:prenyltransferase/squalene oxidase repeat-containing protein [Kitasatospora purpeofusca]MDY0816076.1 prenyltransferase/squalene oxidase repeat-containing protein [Kitasatospora purpeofusca]